MHLFICHHSSGDCFLWGLWESFLWRLFLVGFVRLACNTPFRKEICTFLFWMVYCGIWVGALWDLWVWYRSRNNIVTHADTFQIFTHWGRDKMDAISQTTLSNAFSWMKMLEFQLKFPWSLFIRGQLTIFQHWFRWWLGAGQATSHYLNQWW